MFSLHFCRLLLLPLSFLGPTNPHGGGCCLESVSRAFVIPLPCIPSFVNLTAEVIGQSPELLGAYLRTAADVSAADGDDQASSAAIVQTVLAIVSVLHHSPPFCASHKTQTLSPILGFIHPLPSPSPPSPIRLVILYSKITCANQTVAPSFPPSAFPVTHRPMLFVFIYGFSFVSIIA